jgi:hypothetical protein
METMPIQLETPTLTASAPTIQGQIMRRLSFRPMREQQRQFSGREVDEMIEERLRGLRCSRWTGRSIGSGVGPVEAAKVNLDRAILLHL